MYKVLSEFIEGDHHYKKNDGYPFSDAVEFDQDRAEYLADAKANGRVAFIEKLIDEAADQTEESPADLEPDEVVDIDSMKVGELRELLTEAKVDFDEKAKREVLLNLVKENIVLPE